MDLCYVNFDSWELDRDIGGNLNITGVGQSGDYLLRTELTKCKVQCFKAIF